MSQRTTLRPVVLPTIDMSQSSTNSSATVLQSMTLISYEVSWSGSTPTGTLALQISNSYSLEPNGTVNATGTWTTVPMDVNGAYATSIAISGNTGNGIIDVALIAGYASRLVYTRSGGSGTMTITVVGKVS